MEQNLHDNDILDLLFSNEISWLEFLTEFMSAPRANISKLKNPRVTTNHWYETESEEEKP